MALSFSKQTIGGLPYVVTSAQRKTVTDVTFDSSYPTGGEAFTASDLGLNVVDSASVEVKSVAGTVNVANVFADLANSKLIAYDETPAQVANAADLTDVVVRVTAHGK